MSSGAWLARSDLVLVRRVAEDTGSQGVRGHGVPPQGRHLGPQDAQHLAQEALQEAGQPASLPHTAGLPDVEEVEVAEVVVYPGTRHMGGRRDVHPDHGRAGRTQEVRRWPGQLQFELLVALRLAALVQAEHKLALLHFPLLDPLPLFCKSHSHS